MRLIKLEHEVVGAVYLPVDKISEVYAAQGDPGGSIVRCDQEVSVFLEPVHEVIRRMNYRGNCGQCAFFEPGMGMCRIDSPNSHDAVSSIDQCGRWEPATGYVGGSSHE